MQDDQISEEKSKQEEFIKKRNKRSIAIALSLIALMILFYLATILRLGGNVFNRPL